jgi:hypothetical protein
MKWYEQEQRAMANRDSLLDTIDRARAFGEWETRKERAADPLQIPVPEPDEEQSGDFCERGRR